ncbi:hypothetical protein Tco_0657214 [Tanacetum coccineum]|uniref:Uncharacterized protein n=1 Tax=Tanacetum coccineum TaxID=301880 RepID=A0ABQ4XAZ6_9ASTR
MSVHNFEHNSLINSDHDDDVHDPVTRIRKNKIGFNDGSCKRSNTDEYDAMIELPKCVCNASECFKKHNLLLKLMQFLMGLDDSYMQIRSSILSREVLPDVRSAYATISSEESHRVIVGSIAGENQHMTYTDKELDNVFDISHLRIKMGHPNGTKAYISKIENLRAKQTREPFPLSDYTSKSLGDLVHLDLWGPYRVISYEGFSDSINVFQDVNHINFFEFEYPTIPNDDERVANDLNKGKSDSNSSSVSGSNINTVDFPVDSGNDADSNDELVATHNEKVATLEENVSSEGNLDQNPSTSHDVQNVIRSSRQSVFPRNYNDFVVESKVKYGLEKYVGYSKLNYENYCFVTQLNKTREPKTYFEASKYSHWTDAMNQEMDALLRSGT